MINYDYSQTHEYLTEKRLKIFLNEFLPNSEIIHDKTVTNSNIKNRPDFRIENLKLIIEFNGKFHYTNTKNILNDFKKKKVYSKMGYQVKHIPYWIQLKTETIYWLFNNVIELDENKIKDFNLYPHGFIDDKCPFPASYCSLGIERLIKERKFWDKIMDNMHKKFDFTLLDQILNRDTFFNVATKEVIPYFKEFFFNNGYNFEYEFDHLDFPNIEKELNILWK